MYFSMVDIYNSSDGIRSKTIEFGAMAAKLYINLSELQI